VYNAWNELVAVKNSSGTTWRRSVTTAWPRVTNTVQYDHRSVLLEPGQYWRRWSGVGDGPYVWSPVYVNAMVCGTSRRQPGTLNQRLWCSRTRLERDALVNAAGVVERYVYSPYGWSPSTTPATRPCSPAARTPG